MDSGKGGFKGIFLVMLASLLIAFFWDNATFIKNAAHSILDPSVGILLEWHLLGGMTIIVLVISIFMTLVQKYATDQETLKSLKKEQKDLQGEMKKYKDHPEKMVEMQKKQMEFIPKMMKMSMRPVMFTGIPLILFFRWFMDFFAAAGNPKMLGLSWFWFYLIGSMIFSSILRKTMKVV
jgi:uncharacterized membrane protein (DUF106 family)